MSNKPDEDTPGYVPPLVDAGEPQQPAPVLPTVPPDGLVEAANYLPDNSWQQQSSAAEAQSIHDAMSQKMAEAYKTMGEVLKEHTFKQHPMMGMLKQMSVSEIAQKYPHPGGQQVTETLQFQPVQPVVPLTFPIQQWAEQAVAEAAGTGTSKFDVLAASVSAAKNHFANVTGKWPDAVLFNAAAWQILYDGAQYAVPHPGVSWLGMQTYAANNISPLSTGLPMFVCASKSLDGSLFIPHGTTGLFDAPYQYDPAHDTLMAVGSPKGTYVHCAKCGVAKTAVFKGALSGNKQWVCADCNPELVATTAGPPKQLGAPKYKIVSLTLDALDWDSAAAEAHAFAVSRGVKFPVIVDDAPAAPTYQWHGKPQPPQPSNYQISKGKTAFDMAVAMMEKQAADKLAKEQAAEKAAAAAALKKAVQEKGEFWGTTEQLIKEKEKQKADAEKAKKLASLSSIYGPIPIAKSPHKALEVLTAEIVEINTPPGVKIVSVNSAPQMASDGVDISVVVAVPVHINVTLTKEDVMYAGGPMKLADLLSAKLSAATEMLKYLTSVSSHDLHLLKLVKEEEAKVKAEHEAAAAMSAITVGDLVTLKNGQLTKASAGDNVIGVAQAVDGAAGTVWLVQKDGAVVTANAMAAYVPLPPLQPDVWEKELEKSDAISATKYEQHTAKMEKKLQQLDAATKNKALVAAAQQKAKKAVYHAKQTVGYQHKKGGK